MPAYVVVSATSCRINLHVLCLRHQSTRLFRKSAANSGQTTTRIARMIGLRHEAGIWIGRSQKTIAVQ